MKNDNLQYVHIFHTKQIMKVLYFYFGTKAELIKLTPLIIACKQKHIKIELIHSGQNKLNDPFLEQNIFKSNKTFLSISKQPQQSVFGLFIWFGKTMIKTTKLLLRINKAPGTYLLVHGDTLSTLIGSVSGKITGFKIAHVEAGLRSFDYLNPFPEEICRVIVSKMTDLHFSPNNWALSNLKNVAGVKINTENNTLIESLELALLNKPSDIVFSQLLKSKKYFVFVFHRQENLMNRKLFQKMINEMLWMANKMTCVFILHKHTEVVLKSFSTLCKRVFTHPNIIIKHGLIYSNMMHLLKGAELIVTDGGSNQEEAYYLGLPCILLRRVTERNEGIGQNVVITKFDSKIIRKLFNNYLLNKSSRILLKSRPSDIIINQLQKV